MSARSSCRPRRRLVNEAFPLAVALASIMTVAAVFPREALTFRPSPVPAEGRPAGCAFVWLAPGQEARVLADARTAWQVGGKGVRRMRAELLTAELPEPESEPIACLGDRTRVARPEPLGYAPSLVPSVMAAGEPAWLTPVEGAAEQPTFPREELLTIN